MKLSIIIPVYNEEKTIAEVLANVASVSLPVSSKELIVVDDGSKDNTEKQIEKVRSKIKGLIVIKHEKNQGKGAAVRTGIQRATGDYLLIQDADLEYNPNDIPNLISQLKDHKAQVVYGTRLKRMPNLTRDERRVRFLIHYLGNKGLSLITSMLYGQWITDMETGYKLFPRKSLEGVVLHARSFDFEPEITAKLMKKGYKITEVPITTNPRGYEEGKKLNTTRDGAIALWTLLKYRIVD